MMAGDLVITRLKTSEYYIGEIEGSLITSLKEKYDIDYLGWGYNVKNWYKLGNDEVVPGCIVGRISQRQHSTIQRIKNNFQIIMHMNQLYDFLEKNPNKAITFCEYKYKLRLNKNNFAESIDASALEDLMYYYMMSQHNQNNNKKDECKIDECEKYELRPSSCKINRIKYEFTIENSKGDKETCQVKNRASFNPEDYKSDDYKKIYLYSGMWNQEDIEKYTEEYKSSNNIKIVSKDDLYQFIINNKNEYWVEWLFPSRFIDLENQSENILEIEQSEWKEVSQNRKAQRYNKYKFIDKEKKQIWFKVYEGPAFTYYKDWGCFVLEEGDETVAREEILKLTYRRENHD